MSKEKKTVKLRVYKLQRDNRRLIIQQIEWLLNETGEEFDCDTIKALFPLNKNKLIEKWVQLVQQLNYPNLEWLQIYY